MKKRVKLGIVLCILTFMLASCEDSGVPAVDDDLAIFESYDTNHERACWCFGELVLSSLPRVVPLLDGYVDMIVYHVDIVEKSVIVKIRNNSGYRLRVMDSFSLSIFYGSDWRGIPWAAGMPPPALSPRHHLQPNETIFITECLNLLTPLKPGLYRILTSVDIYRGFRIFEVPDITIAFLNIHDITAEFIWE